LFKCWARECSWILGLSLIDPAPFPPDMSVISSVEENFSWGKSSSADGHAAFSAQMDGLPVSGTIEAKFKKGTRNWAEFEALERELIVPTPGYLKESMARPVVKEFLGKRLLPTSVFMITRLKVARRAKLGPEKADGGGGMVKIGADLMIGVQLGPDVGGNVEVKDKVEPRATDFVWAFSLRQVHYRRGVIGKSRTYMDGATLEGNSREGDEENEEDEAAIQRPSSTEISQYLQHGLGCNNDECNQCRDRSSRIV
jgi:hypothetical protein